ncbi:MAG: DUF2236 domain-containing protein [Cyclobacteriaceae bacterium]
MNKHPLRLSGDQHADDLFLWLKSNVEVYQQLLQVRTNAELQSFLTNYPAFKFYEVAFSTKPDFSSAHGFFVKNTQSILAVLGLYSLPYCYAGANGARVLVQSKKILENPKVRLLETAQFVFDVCEPRGFSPGGKGFVSVLKVRLMHAAARYYASKSIEDEVPINQEDMIGTFLSFSLLVIRGVRTLGINVSQEMAQSYFSLWIKIGILMGIDPENIPTSIKQASVTERQIRRREFKKSEAGLQLTQSLIAFLQSESGQLKGLNPTDIMSVLLGKEVSNILGLPETSALKTEGLGALLKARNFFEMFTQTHFEEIRSSFDQNLIDANVKPDYAFSFE